ncbi:glutamate racemase [Nesterenkonia halophila]
MTVDGHDRGRQAPIGIFDSGVGGLTVARAVLDQLPDERLIYIGDTAHGPYGPLPIARVRAHALGVMDELVDAGVKALVIACNSASAAVLRDARERYTARYGIPVVEVIQPATRRAAAATRSGRIGVIGTAATIGSRAYEDAFAAAPHLQVHGAACPRFVEFVERGITASDELIALAEEYLAPLQAAAVDTLVLGCTHYPLLTGVVSYVMGEEVTLVSSAEETAKDLFAALTRHGLLNAGDTPGAGEHSFLSTGDSAAFQQLARRFLGPEVASVRRIDHVTETYPTGVIRRITPDMLAAARGSSGDAVSAGAAGQPVDPAAGTRPAGGDVDRGLGSTWN